MELPEKRQVLAGDALARLGKAQSAARVVASKSLSRLAQMKSVRAQAFITWSFKLGRAEEGAR
jgi:hypothetical protein